MDVEAFEKQKQLVLNSLNELAAMSPGGGLYIQDMDCDGSIYSLKDIQIDDKGHVVVNAFMWDRTDLSNKTGYFRG